MTECSLTATNFDPKSIFQVHSGLLVDILRTVHSEMNFSYTLIPIEMTGLLNDENEWTGLVGMVAKNEVDFTVMDLTILSSRLKVNNLAQHLSTLVCFLCVGGGGG